MLHNTQNIKNNINIIHTNLSSVLMKFSEIENFLNEVTSVCKDNNTLDYNNNNNKS